MGNTACQLIKLHRAPQTITLTAYSLIPSTTKIQVARAQRLTMLIIQVQFAPVFAPVLLTLLPLTTTPPTANTWPFALT